MIRLFILLTILTGTNTHAQLTQSSLGEELSLLEIGVGAITIDIPDYPGSGHNTTHTIPFPAAIYRGDLLRADEEGGVRTRFFHGPRMELNMSVGGQLPSNSEENPDRTGMPDLHTIIELGPGLIFHFIPPSRDAKRKLSLNVPLRYAISSDLKRFDGRGFIFNPVIYYIEEQFLLKHLTLFTSFDTRFATRRLHDYFYSVTPQFATSHRPHYQAKGGYLGSSLSLGLTYSFKRRLNVIFGLYHSNYQGSPNLDSPLFAKKETTSIGIGLIWWFYQSDVKGLTY